MFRKELIDKIEEQGKKNTELQQEIQIRDTNIQHLNLELQDSASKILKLQQEKENMKQQIIETTKFINDWFPELKSMKQMVNELPIRIKEVLQVPKEMPKEQISKISHFSETATYLLCLQIVNKLGQDYPNLALPYEKIRQLVFDLNKASFEKGDYERQSLVQKFTHEISNIIPAITPKDAKMGWKIYKQFKDELDKKPLTAEQKSKPVVSVVLQQKASGRPRLPKEMEEDVVSGLNRGDTYCTIREQIFVKYKRKISIATISKLAHKYIKEEDLRVRRNVPDSVKEEIISLLNEGKSHNEVRKCCSWKPSLGTISKLAHKYIVKDTTNAEMLGSAVDNDIVKEIREIAPSYKNIIFFDKVIAKLSQELNENKGKIYNTNQILKFIEIILSSFKNKNAYPSTVRIQAYIMYFWKDGQILKQGMMYVIAGRIDEELKPIGEVKTVITEKSIPEPRGFQNEIIKRLATKNLHWDRFVWSQDCIRDISIALNSSYETVLSVSQIKDIIEPIVAKYRIASEYYDYRKYFEESGMLRYESPKTFRIIKDISIPQQKKSLGILEELGYDKNNLS